MATQPVATTDVFEAVQRLDKDMKKAATTLSPREARWLVDRYYLIQDQRIRTDAQMRAMKDEPNDLLLWMSKTYDTLENDIRRALTVFSQSKPEGVWAQTQMGVGPVLAAGLMAHIDPEKARTAGQIWRFAGLDPTLVWSKGQKRPWNASLKVIAWKLGESFTRVSGKDEAVYGQVYVERKRYEVERNERHQYAEQAQHILATKKIGLETEAIKWYKQDMLPPGQIHARAKRYAVKLFLSHYQYVIYELLHGVPPSDPYAISIMGHDRSHFISPPGWPLKTA